MKRRITALVLVLMAVCLVFAGCSKPVKADISGYENEKITIEGLGDETITVTAGELKELDCIRKSVTTQSKGGEITVEAAGPTLETLLEQYGVSMDDVSEVTFVASDGYTKQFDSAFFTTHKDVYLSLADGDDPLQEDEQPLRIVIPGVTSDNWVKGVVEMRFR